MYSVVASVMIRLIGIVVIDEERDSTADELDEMDSVDREGTTNSWISNFKDVDEAGDAFLVMEADDDDKFHVARVVLDCSSFVHHVRPCWIIENAYQWSGNCGVR